MSEKPEKKKKAAPKKDKSRLDISMTGIVDNIVFSKTDQWAYYRISNTAYDFLSNESKASLGFQISGSFSSLMSDRQEPLDCHTIITSVPIDVDAWGSQVREIVGQWGKTPAFEKYIFEQTEFLKHEEYVKKVTYLGINLGKRGALSFDDMNIFEIGFAGAIEFIKKWAKNALMLPTEEVSLEEERAARKNEEKFFRTLSVGRLKAERCTAEELLLLIKRQFYPAMPAPYLEVDYENRIGPGDIELEAVSAIENKYRWIKINQMVDDQEMSGYRATLSFSRFPKYMELPGGIPPFMYFPSMLQLPFTCYSRFTLTPNQKMKAELEKKRKESKDELENMSGSQSSIQAAVSPNVEVGNALGDLQEMTEMLSGDKTPWLQGHFRIVVETPSEEILRKYCSLLKQKYNEMDITLSWSSGDQAALFLEQMPGDKVRMDSFRQVSNIHKLAVSGMNFSSDVGDLIYGSDGDSRK